MTNARRFVFLPYESDIKKGLIHFHYSVITEGEQFSFTETLQFTPPEGGFTGERQDLVARITKYLHLTLGMSYWKLFCPGEIETPYDLTANEAEFFHVLYTKGLGEFFYKNSIDFRPLLTFPSGGAVAPSPVRVNPKNRSLVLSGAGKDSIVTGELLKKHNKPFDLFTLNPTAIHEEVARIMGASLITMKRTIDPLLVKLNKRPDTYNGHVPITSIFMFTGLLAAALYDYRFVIASNEESASYGNVEYLGEIMNHQWSKSIEYEQMLASFVAKNISSDISVFSLLRPVTEMKIAKLFSALSSYFHAFTSCNTNFKITGDPRRGQWCGTCPKCAFVFLLLAAHLKKDTVVDIFGKNLFADATLIPTYNELLGREGFKPFECVGTPEESTAALEAVRLRGEFSNDSVVASLTQRASASRNDMSPAGVYSVSQKHFVPDDFSEIRASL